jgi:hypothetical protein
MIENDDDEYSISTSEYSEYSEYSDDEYDNMYEPEEISSTKYNLVLAEIYNESVHGANQFSEINNYYMVLYRFKQYKIYSIDECIDNYLFDLERWLNSTNTKHSTIRNYNFICFRIKPEIAECIYLHTGECVCVFKTVWLRLIQRTWKKIYKIRQDIIKQRCKFNTLLHRETRGKWPSVCAKMPTLFGMLAHYKKPH